MAYSRISATTIPAPSASQTNFTFVLAGTLADLKTVANSGYINNTVARVGVTCPADFVLSLSSTGSPAMSFGFAKYVATTGEYEIWVKIASWTASFTLYALFGDASVNTYQGGAQGSEYSADVARAYPFPDGTTLSLRDFSTSDVTLTNTNTVTAGTGQIDGDAVFNGTSNYLSSTTTGLPLGTTSRTASMWIKFDGTYTGFNIFFSYGVAASPQLFGMYIDQASPHHLFYWGAGNDVDSGVLVPVGSWAQVVLIYSAPAVTFYINGAFIKTANPATPLNTGAGNLNIGRAITASGWFHGPMDNVVIRSVALTSTWIADEYANQSAPTTLAGSTSNGGTVSMLSILGAG